MISGAFCSVFWSTLSVLLSTTTYMKFDKDLEMYWKGPCYLTPNNHPILGYLQPSPPLYQCKEYEDPFPAILEDDSLESLPQNPNLVQLLTPVIVKTEGLANSTIFALIPFPEPRSVTTTLTNVPVYHLAFTTSKAWPWVANAPTGGTAIPTAPTGGTTIPTDAPAGDHAIWITTTPANVPTGGPTIPTPTNADHAIWITTTPTNAPTGDHAVWITTTPANIPTGGHATCVTTPPASVPTHGHTTWGMLTNMPTNIPNRDHATLITTTPTNVPDRGHTTWVTTTPINTRYTTSVTTTPTSDHRLTCTDKLPMPDFKAFLTSHASVKTTTPLPSAVKSTAGFGELLATFSTGKVKSTTLPTLPSAVRSMAGSTDLMVLAGDTTSRCVGPNFKELLTIYAAGRVRSSTLGYGTVKSFPSGETRSTALMVVTSGDTSSCVDNSAPSKLSDFEEFLATRVVNHVTSTQKYYEVVVASGVRSEFLAQCDISESRDVSGALGPSKCEVGGTCSTDVGFVKEYEQCMERCVHLDIWHPHLEESFVITEFEVMLAGLLLFLVMILYFVKAVVTKIHKLFKKERAARLALEARVSQLQEDAEENLELVEMLQECNRELHNENTNTNERLDATNERLEAEKVSRLIVDLKCTHLQKEAEMNAVDVRNAREFLSVFERVKLDNSAKDKTLKKLKYENEDQKKSITFYTDLIEYEVNVSKALRKEKYELSRKLKALEKENKHVKQELSSLMKATAARKELEAEENMAKSEQMNKECLILPFQPYEEDPEIYKYCDAATYAKIRKFKQSFNALAGSLCEEKSDSPHQHAPPSSPEPVTPEPQAPHYFEYNANYFGTTVTSKETNSESESYEIPAVVSMEGLTSASIFDSPHLAHMFGRERTAHPAQTIAHRESMAVFSPLVVHSITSSSLGSSASSEYGSLDNSGSSEYVDANEWA